MRNLESQEQQALFQWVELNKNKYPELELIHAIPNGGYRNKVTAARLKKEGVKSGVFDIFLPVARRKYHGLYIEMKYGRNPLTDNQKLFAERVEKQNYGTAVCYGWEDAKNVILEYLKQA